MSAEIEPKEEEPKEAPKRLKQHLVQHWQIGAKLLELLICCACMGFVYEPVNEIHLGENLHLVGVMYTAYTGYMLINTVLLIGRGVGDRIPFLTNVLFSVNGAILFFVAAVLLVVDRVGSVKDVFHPRDYLLTMVTISVGFAFANIVVFILDAVFTYIRRQDL